MQLDEVHRFRSAFDPASGLYIRSGILDAAGRDTGKEPFMASYPHLLDVGVMGHCDHGRVGLCLAAGVECYQDGLGISQPHMSLQDFARIAAESSGKTYQFALGGRGDPDQHPQFADLLKCCRSHRIVPNFTTSGLGLESWHATVCREYCGAVAVSWYRSDYTLRALEMLVAAGVRTNIHFVLSGSTVAEAIDLLTGERPLPTGVNAIVFLLHKPVGLGSQANVLRAGDPRVQRFFALATEAEACDGEGAAAARRTASPRQRGIKIGFDSCSVPGLLAHRANFDVRSVDACEAARYSAYVTPDMRLVPCSFDQAGRWARDLRCESIEQAWRSSEFEQFRACLQGACPDCEDRELCLGGCPICGEITLCASGRRRSAAGGGEVAEGVSTR